MNSIGLVSTVNDSIEHLLLFVNYHLNIGVDHVVLFIDDPTLKGVDQLNQLSSVTVFLCTEEYWKNTCLTRPDSIEERQTANVNNGAEYLLLNNFEWIMHVDSDELLYSVDSIKSILSNCYVDAVRFEILEAVAESKAYQTLFYPTLFKKDSGKKLIKLAQLLGVTNAIFENEYFRGHTASKMLVKLRGDTKYGIHDFSSNVELKVQNSSSLYLLHFDCVDIDSWKKKWDRRLDGSGKALQMRDNRKKQMLVYKNARQVGERALKIYFKRLHCINLYERFVLTILGMLCRIKIDKSLFIRKN